MAHVALEFVRLFGGGKRGKGWEREVISNCAYAPLTVCFPPFVVQPCGLRTGADFVFVCLGPLVGRRGGNWS